MKVPKHHDGINDTYVEVRAIFSSSTGVWLLIGGPQADDWQDLT